MTQTRTRALRQAGKALSESDRYGPNGLVSIIATVLMHPDPDSHIEGPITRADQIVDALLDAGYRLERKP